MARKFKVYVCNVDGRVRRMVAARSFGEAARFMDVPYRRLKNYGSVTANEHDLNLALSSPGVVFDQNNDLPGKPWEAVKESPYTVGEVMRSLPPQKESPYTVVAVYPDEGQTFTEHVKATDPKSAIEEFWKTRSDDDTGLSVVEVFEGHIKSVMPEACWVDHPKAEEA